jgi:hypothetical protein
MKLFYVPFIVMLITLTSCTENEDQTKEVDKTGSVEVTLHTAHLDSLKDLLTTHYIIWNKGVKMREYDVKDTVPALGNTLIEGESDNGDTREASVRRDYEFYVTVK